MPDRLAVVCKELPPERTLVVVDNASDIIRLSEMLQKPILTADHKKFCIYDDTLTYQYTKT